MKTTVRPTITLAWLAPICACLLSLPVQAQTLFWDGGGNDGRWCNATNWANQSGPDTNYNTLPTAANTILFRDLSPAGNVVLTCDAPVNRVRLTSATVPRTIEIGSSETVDRTLTFGGTAAELIDQTAAVAGRDLTFSGIPNGGGFKLKLVFNNTVSKPINVASVNSSVFISCDISGGVGFEKTGAGKFALSGANTYGGTNTISAGTLLVNSPGSLSSATTVIVKSGGTFGGSGTIGGEVTVNAGGTLSPGASVGTLTLSSNLTLSGNLFIEVDKSLSPSNDIVSVVGTLTNAGTGTVTVSNLNSSGLPLAVGDSFKLFNKPVLNGGALTVVSAEGGVVWNNQLAVDGSIAVVSLPSLAPAAILTIVPVNPTNFSLGGLGVANIPYKVFASTNVTLPIANWWHIGTTNSDAGGLIQFLDPQATNEQRFYRLGQMVP